MLHERRELQQQHQTLQQDLQALWVKSEQERVAQESYVCSVEDCSQWEVDRAREEGKAVTVQFKEAGRPVEQLQRRLDRSKSSSVKPSNVLQHSRLVPIRWSSN